MDNVAGLFCFFGIVAMLMIFVVAFTRSQKAKDKLEEARKDYQESTSGSSRKTQGC